MTRHATREVRDADAFGVLHGRLTRALTAVATRMSDAGIASETIDSLRRTCEDRYFHLNRRVYPMATCYRMSPLGGAAAGARDTLEKQYASLTRPWWRGTLSPRALARARHLIAERAEFIKRARNESDRAWAGGYDESSRRQEEEFLASYGRVEGQTRSGSSPPEEYLALADILIELSKS